MPIAMTCPGCRNRHSFAETLAGKTIQCWHCQQELRVPRPTVETDDEVERRPKPRKVKKKNTNVGLVIGILVACAVAVMALIGVTIWLVARAINDSGGGGRPNVSQVSAPTNAPPTMFGNPNLPAPKPAENPDDVIARNYPTVQEKMTLSTPGAGFGNAITIPYTLTIAPDPDPFANMPQPKFGPKMVRPPTFSIGMVSMVTVVDGQCRETMVMGSFRWDRQGTLEFRTMFGKLPSGTPFFIVSSGKVRISNVIRLP